MSQTWTYRSAFGPEIVPLIDLGQLSWIVFISDANRGFFLCFN